MTQLSKHPVLWDIYNACQLIEACGASEALTRAVAAVSDLLPKVETLVDRLAAAEAPPAPAATDDLWQRLCDTEDALRSLGTDGYVMHADDVRDARKEIERLRSVYDYVMRLAESNHALREGIEAARRVSR